MTGLKKYDIHGKELEEVKVDIKLYDSEVNPQMAKDYVTALLANKRQWSANSKGRSEINHSTKKPHPQKGTGRARQGSLSVSQYKGGAAVHGPKPKFDQHVRINRKEKQRLIRHLIAEKMKSGDLKLLKLGSFKEPKTKTVGAFLKALNIEGKKVLFLGKVGEEQSEMLVKSARNIPGCNFIPPSSLNGYDIMNNQHMIVIDSVFDEFQTVLGGKK
ncbi:MAG: 50S ribosomal protein L4 [Chlamydiia bacterium]|nr:50S ribosomal protein L4 [Chlamydiia bacterium]MCH9616550.1 50S ribosomal protein L4 [Chlamydiia bacterium]MCH9629280.1 50S ribosomal protein L4 [Chlamydiia bacterium]